MPRRLLLLMATLAVVGCARSPATPEAARGQTPRAAPTMRWLGEGRLEMDVAGRRLSCTAFVRGLGNGQARLVLMGDEGVQLVDVETTPEDHRVRQELPDLKSGTPELARMLGQAFATHPESRSWRDDELIAVVPDVVKQWEVRPDGTWIPHAKEVTRVYYGDPLLLRRVEGRSLTITVADYRQVGDELVPHVVTAEGFLVRIRLRLETARALVGGN